MKLAPWIGAAALVVALAPAVSAGHATQEPRFLVLAYPIHTGGPSSLEVVDANGHVVRILSKRTSSGIAVSGDKTLVEYPSAKGLVVEGVDGSNRHLVFPETNSCGSRGVCTGRSVVWSPDDSKLIVGARRIHNGQYQTWLDTVSVATGRSHVLIGRRSNTRYSILAWSAAANKIAFIAANPKYVPNLVIADPNGRGRKTICGNCGTPAEDPALAWSPDGTLIAYGPGAGDTVKIYDVASGATKTVKHIWNATWAPDSNSFASSTLNSVEIFSRAGNLVETKPVKGAYIRAFNADGIYFVTNAAPRSLQVIPTGQSTSEIVFSLPKGQAILWAEPLQ